jgi:hypothetical protein
VSCLSRSSDRLHLGGLGSFKFTVHSQLAEVSDCHAPVAEPTMRALDQKRAAVHVELTGGCSARRFGVGNDPGKKPREDEAMKWRYGQPIDAAQ